jgi:hypothetical protein
MLRGVHDAAFEQHVVAAQRNTMSTVKNSVAKTQAAWARRNSDQLGASLS